MFTSDVASALTLIFQKVFQLFSINYPGTNVSIFGIFMGVTVTAFVISMAHNFTGFSISMASQRGGNNRRIKISKNRQGDDK